VRKIFFTNHSFFGDIAMKKFNRRLLIERSYQVSLVGAGLSSGLLNGCSKEETITETKNINMNLSSSNLNPSKRKFLITVTCTGGADILDSFMAMRSSEVQNAGGNPAALNCFPDEQIKTVGNFPFRAVSVDQKHDVLQTQITTDQSFFLNNHAQDLMVVTTYGSSVTHGLAQERSVNGSDAWKGRTLMDAVAAQYGEGLPIPNLNMGAGGYGQPGKDDSLPSFAKLMPVVNPNFFALSLHSTVGIAKTPNKKILDMARLWREKEVEGKSNFYKTFMNNGELVKWKNYQTSTRKVYEDMNLINKLFFLPSTDPALQGSDDAEFLRAQFPDFATDILDAQAILTYLAITQNVSAAVTFGPSFAPVVGPGGLEDVKNPPIGFDLSHADHRGTQALMWNRTLDVSDRLINCLKQKSLPGSDKTYWDNTALYFATDFGRDKTSAKGTGHHLNNAAVIVSPLANGGQILGGVDYTTGVTFGFDKETGVAKPGEKDLIHEKEFYAGILGILDVDLSEAPDLKAVPAMKKKVAS
jgi:hypothetical protein